MINAPKKWILCLYYVVIYWLPLNWRPLWVPDELRYGQISQAMVLGADWINPHFLGLRYYEKPILGYWLNNFSLQIFGFNPFAVRFMCALSTGISALLLYCCAMRLWQSSTKAFWCAYVYLTMPLVLIAGVFSTLDAILTLWLTAAITTLIYGQTSSQKTTRWLAWLVFGIFAGLAFLTKGFVAWAVLFIVITPWFIYKRAFLELVKGGLFAVLIACLVAAPWVIAVEIKAPDYWHYFFWIEHIQRFFGEHAQHAESWWYYLPILLLGIFPWIGFLPGAIRTFTRFTVSQPNKISFLFGCWLILPFIFFSISRGKLPFYILTCLAPIALMIGYYCGELWQQQRWRLIKLGLLPWTIFTLLFVFLLIGIGNNFYSTPSDQLPYKIALILALVLFFFAAINFYYSRAIIVTFALSAFALTALFILTLPSTTINDKMPTTVLVPFQQQLEQAVTLAADYPTYASALAWQTHREKVYLIEQVGEVQYGLNYADAKAQWVPLNQVSTWLVEKLKLGTVAVLLHENSQIAKKMLMLQPTEIVHRSHVLLLFFKPAK